MNGPGTYALIILCEQRLALPVGRLGIQTFAPGCYVYAGSALGGLGRRLKYHLKSEKRPRWHIDYLLARARVVQIWYCSSGERLECKWNDLLAELSGAMPVIKGFGCSDCRCRTHLTYFPAKPSFAEFRNKLKKSGLPPPRRLMA